VCRRFKTEEEAIAMANDTEYGLAAYCFTKDLSRAFRVAERLEFGMVGVNETAIVSEAAPFGGMKQSGLGREHGKSGILEFVEEKHVCIGL
jgi:succinate-semialdehyde dehydrogenase / glutarate-semialdehyde dehydrogenase